MILKFLTLATAAIFSLVLPSNIFVYVVLQQCCNLNWSETYKENTQQMPLNRPIVMLIVGASFMFLPNIPIRWGDITFGAKAISAAKASRSIDLSGL